MPRTNLERELDHLVQDFTQRFLEVLKGMTLEELLGLSGAAEPAPAAPEKGEAPGREETERTGRPRVQEVAPPSEPAAHRDGGDSEQPETGGTQTPVAPAAQPAPRPVFHDYRRAEAERFVRTVVEFVDANPGADAGLIAMKLGAPTGQTQTVLDDLVLKGVLRMASGQHGRCYSKT